MSPGCHWRETKPGLPLALILILATSSCQDEGEQIKKKILARVLQANRRDVVIDINKLSSSPVTHLCLQTPYLTRQAMEARVGQKLQGFEEVEDDSFVLWLFKPHQPPERLRFNRWQELNFAGQPSSCVASAKLRIMNSRLYLTGAN
jgi:hypothetical protein